MPSFALRAFRYRNYRLFFGGQGLSLIGTWLTIVATNWLVYRLAVENGYEPARTLGYAAFLGQLPVLLVGPFGGVLADRFSPRKLLLATQTVAMIQSGILAWLAFARTITIPQIVALNILGGVVNAFDMPARQAFIFEIIEDREDLPNAIALNSSMFNGARLLGPAVAGLIIAAAGEGWCFLVDAISYLAVIAALAAMRVPPRVRKPSGHTVFREMLHGLRYSAGFPPVRSALTLVAVISLMTMAVTVLLPIFATNMSGPGHGASVLGFLQAASGSGALLGGIYLAARRSVRGLGRIVGMSCLTLGVAVFCLGLSNDLLLSLVCMFTMGFGMLLTFASLNTILQTIIDDDKRGRVMSLFGISFLGVAPFGNLLGGVLASHIGAHRTAYFAGCACCVAGVVFLLRLPGLRKIIGPIYQSKGVV